MHIKKAAVSIFQFIKRRYLAIFSFLAGEEKRKFSRLFVHMNTLICMFLFPPVYITGIVQTFLNNKSIVLVTMYAVFMPLFFGTYLLLIKVGMYLSNRWQ